MLRKRLRTQPSSMTNVLLRVLLGDSPCLCLSVLSQVRPPTGEPDAGDPPVRFGGRGNRIQSVLPTPISLKLTYHRPPLRKTPCARAETICLLTGFRLWCTLELEFVARCRPFESSHHGSYPV